MHLNKNKNRIKLAKLSETSTVIALSPAKNCVTTTNERIEESTELNPKRQKLNYKKITSRLIQFLTLILI